jgi:hypothetical protein
MRAPLEVKMGSERASRTVAPAIKKDLKGIKRRVNGLASKEFKEGIVNLPGAGDTWYVQMNTLEALL